MIGFQYNTICCCYVHSSVPTSTQNNTVPLKPEHCSWELKQWAVKAGDSPHSAPCTGSQTPSGGSLLSPQAVAHPPVLSDWMLGLLPMRLQGTAGVAAGCPQMSCSVHCQIHLQKCSVSWTYKETILIALHSALSHISGLPRTLLCVYPDWNLPPQWSSYTKNHAFPPTLHDICSSDHTLSVMTEGRPQFSNKNIYKTLYYTFTNWQVLCKRTDNAYVYKCSYKSNKLQRLWCLTLV